MKRARRDERGASLLLAVAFMVVIGGIGAAIVTAVTSGVRDRSALDVGRNQQYAADGAIENAIAAIRAITPAAGYQGPAFATSPCGALANHSLNSVTIHVDCTGVPGRTLSGFLQQNVVFTACLAGDVVSGACPTSPDKTIVRAQVNFQSVGSGAAFQIQRTWIQSWSVNR